MNQLSLFESANSPITEELAAQTILDILRSSSVEDCREYADFASYKKRKTYTSILIGESLLFCTVKYSRLSYIAFDLSFKEIITKNYVGDKDINSKCVRLIFKSIDDILSMRSLIEALYVKALRVVAAEEMFDCCSRYLQCSDVKKCLHPDKLRALSCAYRRRLKNGIIYYGNNRNVK